MKSFASLTFSLLAYAMLAQVPPAGRPGGPSRNRPGPWDNDVLVYRVASGGQAEKLGTFERAGVPTAARLKEGRLIAAFQNFPTDNDRDFDRVAVAFSDDEGRTWSKPETISVAGMESGLARPFDPTLVPLPDGRVRLYFTSNRSPDFRRSTPAIYSAISTNGVHYVFEPGIRFGVEGRVVIDCAVALHQGVFHLLVSDNGDAQEFAERPQRDEPPHAGTGYHAVSRDGLKFERVADVKLPGVGRWLGNMQSAGGKLVFFGTGQRNWPVTSADGTNWHSTDQSMGIPGADPGAVKLRDGAWLLLVTSAPRADTPSARQRPPQVGEGMDARGVRARLNPGGSRERPPGVLPLQSVFVRIPSAAAGEEGVAASFYVPGQARFTNGAPVVVVVNGGVEAGGARGRPEYVTRGFVELHFAFPGGGFGSERSGGKYDLRGPNCVRALADVIRFAAGRQADSQGQLIGQLARGVKVLTNHVGLVGSSNGGNACGMVMAKHGEELAGLAWYASMESPYGEGAVNVELGGREAGLNPAWDAKTGTLDFTKLAWSADLLPGLMRRRMPGEQQPLKGAFFFDLNGDGRFSSAQDFPANCIVGDGGDGRRQAWYSPRLLAAADERKLLSRPYPAHVPTLAETRDFWAWRDPGSSLADAVHKVPGLAVIVYANERDHVQADPAHTHILTQVEGFRKAGARFVRLNPDRAYVERMLSRDESDGRAKNFADNPAGREWTRANISEGLEPAEIAMPVYMQAAVCELADRQQAGNWSSNLKAVLFPGVPGLSLPRPPQLK